MADGGWQKARAHALRLGSAICHPSSAI